MRFLLIVLLSLLANFSITAEEAVPKVSTAFCDTRLRPSYDICWAAVGSGSGAEAKAAISGGFTEFMSGIEKQESKKSGISMSSGAKYKRAEMLGLARTFRESLKSCERFRSNCSDIGTAGYEVDESANPGEPTAQDDCNLSMGESGVSYVISDKDKCDQMYERVAGKVAAQVAQIEKAAGQTQNLTQFITDDIGKSLLIGGGVLGGGILINEMIDDNDDKKKRKEAAKKAKEEAEAAKDAEENGTDVSGYAVDSDCLNSGVLSDDKCVVMYQNDCYTNPSMSTCTAFNKSFCESVPTEEKAKKARGALAGKGKDGSYCLYVNAKSVCSGASASSAALTCSWLSNVNANKASGEICSSVAALSQTSCLVQTTPETIESHCSAQTADPICGSSLKNLIVLAHQGGQSTESAQSTNSVIGSNVSGQTATSSAQTSGTFSAVLTSINNAWNAVVSDDEEGSETFSSSGSKSGDVPVEGLQSASVNLFGASPVNAVCFNGQLADVNPNDCFKN